MRENLKTSRYSNGDSIPIVTDNTAWGSFDTGGRSWYNNDSTTYDNPYGNLYNWYAMADSRGLCPSGWGLPTVAEWTTLTDNLGGESVAASKMKSRGITYWANPSAGTDNSSGFSALPGGSRDNDGGFNHIRNEAYFWSANENGQEDSFLLRFTYDNAYDYSFRAYGGFGASVRCLRD
jgi:uncharacterized protein (TIGR02145 family)